MYLSPWWALSSIQVSCCYQESIWDHSWPIRFGYGRKSMPEAFPNAARIWVSILDGMYLGLTGQKTLRCVDLSVPREGFRRSSFSSRRMSFYFEFLLYPAPIALRCWKHSRQNTGRPCVGRKGTVVSFPHCEQFVFVSERIGEA